MAGVALKLALSPLKGREIQFEHPIDIRSVARTHALGIRACGGRPRIRERRIPERAFRCGIDVHLRRFVVGPERDPRDGRVILRDAGDGGQRVAPGLLSGGTQRAVLENVDPPDRHRRRLGGNPGGGARDTVDRRGGEQTFRSVGILRGDIQNLRPEDGIKRFPGDGNGRVEIGIDMLFGIPTRRRQISTDRRVEVAVDHEVVRGVELEGGIGGTIGREGPQQAWLGNPDGVRSFRRVCRVLDLGHYDVQGRLRVAESGLRIAEGCRTLPVRLDRYEKCHGKPGKDHEHEERDNQGHAGAEAGLPL